MANDGRTEFENNFFGLGFSLISGAAALIYETVWIRAFIPVFGLTVYAGAAVLFAFLLGLLLGSWLSGRPAFARAGVPWRVYGAIELGIGLTAVWAPRILSRLTPGYLFLLQWSSSRAYDLTLRVGVCAAAILIPAVLMGMTLPTLARAMAGQDDSRLIGRIYALNALGGALGTALAAFWLMREFGLTRSALFAAGLNASIGLAGLALSCRAAPTSPAVNAVAGKAAPWPLPLCALAGFCSFTFEMLWLRILVFYFQMTVYSLGMMLICCLLGIALGSWFYVGRWGRRLFQEDARRALAWLVLGMGAANLAAFGLHGRSGRLLLWIIRTVGLKSWRAVALEEFLTVAVLLLPGFFLSGAAFPAFARADAQGSGDIPATFSRVYAANLAGGVLGILLPTFVLLDAWGIQRTFEFACLMCAACSAWLMLGAGRRRLRAWGASLAAFLVFYGCLGSGLIKRSFAAEGKVLFYRDGAADVAAVVQKPLGPAGSVRSLLFGDDRGTCQETVESGSTRPSPALARIEAYPRMIAYSSMAMDPSARSVLIIGMGCGHSAAAFAAFPIKRIDIVDISPHPFEAAALFPKNDGVLADSRVHVHIDDGRNYLLRTRQKYDIIALEPPSLHTDGVVFLYTQEFYRLALSRLNKGGVLTQWIDTIQSGPGLARMLVGTGLRVFRSGVYWSNLGLGSWFNLSEEKDPRIDYRRSSALFRDPRVVADMQGVGIDFHGLLSTMLAAGKILRRETAGARAITDDKTVVDFTVLQSAGMGGFDGLFYYTSPIFLALRAAWHPRPNGPYLHESSFVPGLRSSLNGVLRGWPDSVRRRIIKRALAWAPRRASFLDKLK